MDTIMDLKSKFSIEDSEYQEIKDEVLDIVKKLQERGITFDGHYKVGFYSHMISMIKRLRDGEKVMEISQDALSEIDQYSIQAAEEVLIPLFTKYDATVDKSEVFLVSIHIQAAKNNIERSEEDGK